MREQGIFQRGDVIRAKDKIFISEISQSQGFQCFGQIEGIVVRNKPLTIEIDMGDGQKGQVRFEESARIKFEIIKEASEDDY